LDVRRGEAAAAVMLVYRQAIAVVAATSGSMIAVPTTSDSDEAILEDSAAGGTDGLPREQATVVCRHRNAQLMRHGFDRLCDNATIDKVVGWPNERCHRATFATYLIATGYVA
jgi:hypothetical protein